MTQKLSQCETHVIHRKMYIKIHRHMKKNTILKMLQNTHSFRTQLEHFLKKKIQRLNVVEKSVCVFFLGFFGT